MPVGALNSWHCPKCGRLTVAVHVDEGVTPMMLACRATTDCQGIAYSSGYPAGVVPPHVRDALAWEWRKASTTQMKRWRREHGQMYQHCQMGGLVLAPLSDAGRAAFAAGVV